MKGRNMKKKNKTLQNGTGNVYCFHNTRTGVDLFMNAQTATEASCKFDTCNFKNRTHWKIMVELTHQPT